MTCSSKSERSHNPQEEQQNNKKNARVSIRKPKHRSAVYIAPLGNFSNGDCAAVTGRCYLTILLAPNDERLGCTRNPAATTVAKKDPINQNFSASVKIAVFARQRRLHFRGSRTNETSMLQARKEPATGKQLNPTFMQRRKFFNGTESGFQLRKPSAIHQEIPLLG